jgi:hypothetical protein
VVENARLLAKILAQVGDLEASGARIVEAADAEWPYIERDLHDSAQQRLVGLALGARTAPNPNGGACRSGWMSFSNRTHKSTRTFIPIDCSYGGGGPIGRAGRPAERSASGRYVTPTLHPRGTSHSRADSGGP